LKRKSEREWGVDVMSFRGFSFGGERTFGLQLLRRRLEFGEAAGQPSEVSRVLLDSRG
jgi:hypothetical protein